MTNRDCIETMTQDEYNDFLDWLAMESEAEWLMERGFPIDE